MDGSGIGQWCRRTSGGRRWSRSWRRAGRRARRRPGTCGGRWRRSSGGTRTARSGGGSPPRSAPGGGGARPSSAGPRSGGGSGRLEGARGGGAAAGGGAGARGRARHGVPRRDLDQGPPQGRGCAQKRGTSRERDRREALGRSRGGFGTKACVIADGRGRAVAFALAPGQAHELPLAPGLLDQLPRVPLWVVGDRGYSPPAFRELVGDSGARPAIPTRGNEAAVACPDYIYNNRNLVERLWGRLMEWRAVATRYEKTATSPNRA